MVWGIPSYREMVQNQQRDAALHVADHHALELGADEPPMRTDFQRDADRIIFSPAFRRLKDKTQVFPLPENDLIHSRLTHSTEVAVVGRSSGMLPVVAILVAMVAAATSICLTSLRS